MVNNVGQENSRRNGRLAIVVGFACEHQTAHPKSIFNTRSLPIIIKRDAIIGIDWDSDGVSHGKAKMSISEAQLQTWTNLGAQKTAQNTHELIRDALSEYRWPEQVVFDTHLQGSYKNHTNIYANSDVDLVATLTSTFYSNLSQEEQTLLGHTTASYQWSDFRSDINQALTQKFGSNFIDGSGSKSIKVMQNTGRLKADVVVAAEYRYYENLKVKETGIIFFMISRKLQIINYPELHFRHGADKNYGIRTQGNYKRVIRMFKNARERAVRYHYLAAGVAPSYFIECLLYNVPDRLFQSNLQSSFLEISRWLTKELSRDGARSFRCQNEMFDLFGNSTVQWKLEDAQEFARAMIFLWDNP